MWMEVVNRIRFGDSRKSSTRRISTSRVLGGVYGYFGYILRGKIFIKNISLFIIFVKCGGEPLSKVGDNPV